MRFTVRPLILLAALALLAGACSSDDGDEAAPETPPTTAAVTPEPTSTPSQPQGSLASAGDEADEDGPSEGGVLRVGLAEVETPDPALGSPGSQSALVLADLLFDGLTEWDAASGELRPALASSWELADDLLSWEFLLDEGAEFSNGDPVSAADVKASLERVVSTDPLEPAATRLEVLEGYSAFADGSAESISGIEVVDEGTLRFRLTSPFSQLPQLLASPIYGIVTGSLENFNDVVTSGSFVVASAADRVVILETRDTEAVFLDGVEIQLFEDRASAAEALEQGDVDWAVISRDVAGEADDELADFQAQLNFEMTVTTGVLSDVALRRAIMTGVDAAAIAADVYPGTARAVDGLVPGSGACGEGDETCGYSPETAQAIIEDAFPDGDVPTVHVDYYVDESGREKAVAEAIAADLEAIGIPAEAREHEFFDFADKLASGDLELFRSGWVALYPSPEAWLGRYHSESLDNLGFLISTEADEALDAARAADTADDAAAAYADAEAAILRSAPVLPLLQFKALSAASEVVQDLDQRLDGTFDVTKVWLLP